MNEPIETPLKGILVIYLNVGQLPPQKAEAFVERYKEKLNKGGFLDRLKAGGIEIMFVLNRETTAVELLKL
jgi:hypothetical protein